MVGLFQLQSVKFVLVFGAFLSMVRVVSPATASRHNVCAESPRVKMGRLLSFMGLQIAVNGHRCHLEAKKA